jgi:hypothetical protein
MSYTIEWRKHPKLSMPSAMVVGVAERTILGFKGLGVRFYKEAAGCCTS